LYKTEEGVALNFLFKRKIYKEIMIFKQNKTKDKGFGGQKKLKINNLFLNKKKDQP